MDKVIIAVLLILIAVAFFLLLGGYKVMKLTYLIAVSLLLIVFAAFFSRIFIASGSSI